MPAIAGRTSGHEAGVRKPSLNQTPATDSRGLGSGHSQSDRTLGQRLVAHAYVYPQRCRSTPHEQPTDTESNRPCARHLAQSTDQGEAFHHTVPHAIMDESNEPIGHRVECHRDETEEDELRGRVCRRDDHFGMKPRKRRQRWQEGPSLGRERSSVFYAWQ